MILNDYYKNNHITARIVSVVQTESGNVAIIRRVEPGDFVVVNRLETDDNEKTCGWAFAYAYNLDADEARKILAEKVQ